MSQLQETNDLAEAKRLGIILEGAKTSVEYRKNDALQSLDRMGEGLLRLGIDPDEIAAVVFHLRDNITAAYDLAWEALETALTDRNALVK